MPIQNGVMMQFFHWYSPGDGSLWREAQAKAKELAEAGFTGIWLPPATKGAGGGYDVGYGVYDLHDLGEFDQKGSVRTKYGTKAEYLAAIKTLQQSGIQVYADAVLNHRLGGDAAELVRATPYPQDNRLQPKGEMREIEAFTHFNFAGRQGQHSTFEFHSKHFDAVDYDQRSPGEKNTIYLFEGKQFDDYVALEKGNYSFLMGADLDYQNEETRNEVTAWGKWFLDTTGVDGFRLDAVKHIAAWFFPQWLDEMERHAKRELFFVGEYWTPDMGALEWFLNALGGRITLFSVPLHYRFSDASKAGGKFDMRRILEGTLMKERSREVVTFVENHDSQPLQALESPVEPWFKPLAYALILLRRDGYPCVFYADYYGAEYEDYGRDGNKYKITMPSFRPIIDKLLHARRQYAWGPQIDYFDHENVVGWVRLGDDKHPKPMAVLMSDGEGGSKVMEVGYTNKRFVDLTENVKEPVQTNEAGFGEFRCNGGSVSVWVPG